MTGRPCSRRSVMEADVHSPQCKLINPIPPNQSILKEVSLQYSLEGLMLKLKLQSSGHLMRRADSLEKTLMLGETEAGRRRG